MMAKAKMKTKTTKTVALKLSEPEALFLAVVLSKISGHPSDSPREYQESIALALAEAGVFWGDFKFAHLVENGMHVRDYPQGR
jgi:hypothetical protein